LTAFAARLIINRLVNHQQRVTAVFSALADPTRRRILARLSGQGESAVAALSKPFRISAPAISRHLRVLERARLIDRRRQGRVHLIRPRRSGLEEARHWMDQCAAGWNFSFDALDALLKSPERKDRQP
jgi:DNA-binding transcriptional ArsR family regulator